MMRRRGANSAEQGFMLVGLIVAIALILLTLGIAAPKLARSRRDREVEAVHRGNQYVRAIQLYYRKFGHYPGSMEALEKSNNIRFLRQQYGDPTNHDAKFRLIPVGQNQTTVKGFFGQPLAGIASAGLGSAAGLQSAGVPGGASSNAPAGTFGGTAGPGTNGAPTAGSGATGVGGVTAAAGTTGTPGIGGGTSGGNGTGTGSSTDSSSSSSPGSAVPFMGVGLSHPGASIVEPNEQSSYDTWEFLYDPRIELLKQKAAALGGGLSSGAPATGGFGSGSGTFGGQPPPGTSTPTAPGPTGLAPPSGSGVPGTTPPQQ